VIQSLQNVLPSLRRVAALGLLATVLAGCGANPTATRALRQAKQPVAVAPVESPVYPGQPSMTGTDPEGPAKVKAILANVASAKLTTRNYTCKAHTEVTGPDGHKTWNTSQVAFKAPSTMAAYVVDASDAKTLKTKLVYGGHDDIDVKTYFFGFIAIKINLKVDDYRLVDVYKRSLRDTQASQLMALILDPRTKATYAGAAMVAGEQVDQLDLVSPLLWSGVSHEVVSISRRLALPIGRQVYDMRGKRIVNMELSGMRTNVQMASDAFTL
jgi:hypothetical protein